MEDMSLKHALLGVLAARPMSGYELSQFFDSSTGWVWTAPHSQIYPLLVKMHSAGLIENTKKLRGTKMNVKVYSITPTGTKELVDWVGAPHSTPGSRDPLLTQALLFDMIDPDSAAGILIEFIAEQQSIADESRAHSRRLAEKGTPLLKERLRNRPEHDHDRIARLKAHVFEGQAMVAEARVAWARDEIRLLRPAATGVGEGRRPA